jgi:hypothetical protein
LELLSRRHGGTARRELICLLAAVAGNAVVSSKDWTGITLAKRAKAAKEDQDRATKIPLSKRGTAQENAFHGWMFFAVSP